MPNHVKNRLTINGTEDQIKEITTFLQKTYENGEVSYMDFNKIIPMPESLNIESGSLGEMFGKLLFGTENSFLSIEEIQKRLLKYTKESILEGVKLAIQYRDNLKEHGHTTWYGWAPANWGTKWNAYDTSLNNNVIEFDTAWSGVPGLIEELSAKFNDVSFIYEYADEDIGANTGYGIIINGTSDMTFHESGSNEAYELALDLHPDSKEYFQLVDGKWSYIEDEDEL